MCGTCGCKSAESGKKNCGCGQDPCITFGAENKRSVLENAIEDWVKNNQPKSKSAARVKARIFTYDEVGTTKGGKNKWETRNRLFGDKAPFMGLPKEGLVISVSPTRKTKALARHLGGLGLIPRKVHYLNWLGYLIMPQKFFSAETFEARTKRKSITDPFVEYDEVTFMPKTDTDELREDMAHSKMVSVPDGKHLGRGRYDRHKRKRKGHKRQNNPKKTDYDNTSLGHDFYKKMQHGKEDMRRLDFNAESYSDEVKAKVFDKIFEWHEQMQLQGEGIEYELDRMRWMLENPDKGYDDYPYTYDGQLREGFDEPEMVYCSFCSDIIGTEEEVYDEESVEWYNANGETICPTCHKQREEELRNDLDPHYSPFYAENEKPFWDDIDSPKKLARMQKNYEKLSNSLYEPTMDYNEIVESKLEKFPSTVDYYGIKFKGGGHAITTTKNKDLAPKLKKDAEYHRDSKGRFAEKPILTGSVIGGLALGLIYLMREK